MGKGKKIIGTIAALGIAAAALFAGVTYFGGNTPTPPGGDPSGNGTGTNPPTSEVLSVVENISYDENRLYFVWDDVENADGYIALINGTQFEVDESECYYVPSTETTEIKVRAVDSTGEYKASDWSDVYTYTLENSNENGGNNGGEITDDQVSYLDVNSMVQSFVHNANLQNIVSIEASGGDVNIKAIFDVNGTNKLYELELTYPEVVESLSDMVKNADDVTSVRESTYVVSEYNCAKYLLRSGELTGGLQNYKDAGYDISIVTSATVKNSNFQDYPYINIYATYKVTKDSEVKYVSSFIRAIVNNPSASEVDNMTCVLSPEARTLSEQQFYILEGDFATFAEQLDTAQNAQAMSASATSQNQSNKNNVSYEHGLNVGYSTDDGMEF